MRTPIVALASLLAVLGLPSYAAASPPVAESEPSTSGSIVWSNRAADGSESLLIANADGSDQRALTHAGKGEVHIDAQFSPNGKWIAYDGAATRAPARSGSCVPTAAMTTGCPCGCKDPCLGLGTPTWISKKRLVFVKVKGPIVERHRERGLAVDGARSTGRGSSGCRTRGTRASTRTATRT